MAVYRCVGEFTYSNKSNRDACLTQVNAAVAGHSTAAPWDGLLAGSGGVTTSGSTTLRVSFELPDEATAVAFEQAVNTAAATVTKSAGALALARVGGP